MPHVDHFQLGDLFYKLFTTAPRACYVFFRVCFCLIVVILDVSAVAVVIDTIFAGGLRPKTRSIWHRCSSDTRTR